MRQLTVSFCLILTLFLFGATSAWSADFYKGLDAYNKGDYATALREWRPLAKQGNASAQSNLGVMYENGDGVPQDYPIAVKWYSLAAEQEFEYVQVRLGDVYYNGTLGVPRDYSTAVKW